LHRPVKKAPLAMRLRDLQTLTSIASDKTSIIVFPMPYRFVRLARAH
jgi:hypothetical protein